MQLKNRKYTRAKWQKGLISTFCFFKFYYFPTYQRPVEQKPHSQKDRQNEKAEDYVPDKEAR